MPQYKDMAGIKVGRLTAISIADPPNPSAKGAYWLCDCECGQQVIVKGAYIRSGVTSSCGCLQKELASLPKERSEEYLNMYLEGFNSREIADFYELKSINSVLRELRKYPEYKPHLSSKDPEVQFWKQQYDFGLSILDIAKKSKVDDINKVRYWLEKQGINITETRIKRIEIKRGREAEILFDIYQKGYFAKEVADIFDLQPKYVLMLLREFYGAEMRTKSQAKRLLNKKQSALTNNSRAINLATNRNDLKPITHKTKDLRWGQDNYDINRREHIL
jgi:arsenate reductase-like glutaredoxin family protein